MSQALMRIIRSETLNLGNVHRYSGIYTVNKESVADHVVQVFYISLGIAKLIENSGPINIDYRDLALRCMIHDIDESITCDIPRNVKYANDDTLEALEGLAKKSVKVISESLGQPIVEAVWNNAKDDSVEGNILSLADMLQVVKKIDDEVIFLGNRHMRKVAHQTLTYLKNSKRKFRYANRADVFLGLIDDSINYINRIL